MKRVILSIILLMSIYFSGLAQTATRNSVVIDEVFVDPTPPVGMPNGEFIELKNCGRFTINLQNWKLSDGSAVAVITGAFYLQPDSFVIVCANAMVPAFSRFGTVIGVGNFPSLNNDADIVVLYAADASLVHAIGYTLEWYQNPIKQEGGWSIEMIDTDNPCGGKLNWKASIASEGAIFTDSYGQQSCTAGRASFILGQEPFRTGLLTIGMPGDPHGITDWMPTIADALKTAFLHMHKEKLGEALLSQVFVCERFESAPPNGYRALYAVAPRDL